MIEHSVEAVCGPGSEGPVGALDELIRTDRGVPDRCPWPGASVIRYANSQPRPLLLLMSRSQR
jgi:hypothetical protein